ncbi:MAG: hypothetical protein ACTHQQ_10625, partial [Solirubrobacteraceae bacterium]
REATLSSVSCPSLTACMAVGGVPFGGPGEGRAASAYWNGKKWTANKLPGFGPAVYSGVSCVASDACTAVGGYSTADRWNGKRWYTQPMPPGDLLAVSCVSRTACTAVGDRNSGQPLIERWRARF